MKKKILDILSILIVLIGVVILVASIVNPIDEIEEAIRLLSISFLYSVFLAGAIYNLLRKE